jgi:hypothetical protein
VPGKESPRHPRSARPSEPERVKPNEPERCETKRCERGGPAVLVALTNEPERAASDRTRFAAELRKRTQRVAAFPPANPRGARPNEPERGEIQTLQTIAPVGGGASNP